MLVNGFKVLFVKYDTAAASTVGKSGKAVSSASVAVVVVLVMVLMLVMIGMAADVQPDVCNDD